MLVLRGQSDCVTNETQGISHVIPNNFRSKKKLLVALREQPINIVIIMSHKILIR